VSRDEEMIHEASSSDDSSESEAEEEPAPRKRKTPVAKKSRKSSTSATTAASAAAGKKTPASAGKKKKGTGGGKKTAAASSSSAGPVNRRQAVAALKTLDKKFVTEPQDETEENSLLVALLRSYNSHGEGGGAKKPKRGATAATEDGESFYTAGIQQIVQGVVEEYGQNSVATEVNLFNLILRSVGGDSDSLLDPETTDLESMTDEDFDGLIQKILKDMTAVPADRTPFLANTTKLTVAQAEYRKIFQEFWYRLVQTALTSEDGEKKERFRVEMARNLVTHMAEMLTLGVPDIRLGILTAVYQMSLAMLERTNELNGKLKTAERQLAVAKRNKQERKKDFLVEQIESWKRTVDDLESYVSDMIVSTVIVKRYRDSCEFARVATLEALTQYCTARPDLFVTNMYLKYFGWMLSDHVAAVRVAAVKGLLIPLEKDNVDNEAMDKVLSKFLGRLTDMAKDTDPEVQEVAMALLLKLLRNEYFEKVEDDQIWEQINSMALLPGASPTFRRDALYFVLDQLPPFDTGTAKTEREAVDQIDQLALWYVFE